MLIFSCRDEYIKVGGFLDKEEKEVLPYPFFLSPYLEPSKLTLSCESKYFWYPRSWHNTDILQSRYFNDSSFLMFKWKQYSSFNILDMLFESMYIMYSKNILVRFDVSCTAYVPILYDFVMNLKCLDSHSVPSLTFNTLQMH